MFGEIMCICEKFVGTERVGTAEALGKADSWIRRAERALRVWQSDSELLRFGVALEKVTGVAQRAGDRFSAERWLSNEAPSRAGGTELRTLARLPAKSCLPPGPCCCLMGVFVPSHRKVKTSTESR